MSIKIRRVRIQNFRSLKNIETTLEDVTLLVGLNNVGKTSFLKALAVALTSDKKFISKDDLFIDKNGNYPETPHIIIDVDIAPINNNEFTVYWAQVFGGDDIQLNNKNEEFIAYRTVIDFTTRQSEALIKRYIIKDWDSRNADENQEMTANISKLPLFYIDAQRDLQDDLKYTQSYFGRLASQIEYDDDKKQKLEKSLSSLNEEAVNTSPVLNHLKTSLEELNRTVQTDGKGVEITPFPKKIRDLHKGLSVNFQDGGSETFSLEYHGMGTRSWASLLGYKAFINWMQKKADDDNEVLHPVLALEEPEAHLHPNAQRQVYSQLQEITGQKIISTHSTYIIPLAKLKELRVFYKKEDSTDVTSFQSLLSEFSAKEIANLETHIIRAKGELLFAKFVVLFEGPTEERALDLFAKKHWGKHAFEKGVSLIYCNGGDYDIYVRLLETIQIPWIIFSDYDNTTVQNKVEKVSNKLGVSVTADDRFILLNASIEQYLIEQGYRAFIEDAYFKITEPVYQNEQHKSAKEAERLALKATLEGLADEEFLKKIDKWKAKIASLWAESIINHSEPTKQIPQKIKDLFEAIDQRV